ncbi:putative pentatricopeptide repeat-containing protein At5g06400, mitochondrial [Juglans microcarpa x Juglans regia]|uniref:putative pentatricopeptide repeat-containing protein At5g06400, mitochondrial n=1 Tax=Juglans microcarpa x Juglans regia TaxID=2249226 RepID=UPI001B7DF4DF|nr:putative pentatricopeptide repeat-containing protein At5g06400, mitochondrial [Juglans microcarpa x Juglans regia]
MRNLIKFRFSCLNSSNKLFRFQLSNFQIRHFSSLSKSSSKLSKSKKTEDLLKNQAETSSFGLLFNEIKDILGADNFNSDITQSGTSIPIDIHVVGTQVKEEHPHWTEGVCRNAEDGVLLGKDYVSALEDTPLGNLGGNDVSPEVHKITQIVRAGNSFVSIEEQLETLSVRFDSEVVEKVLKRCFKVPHLALRFFDWVKLRDGFRHTTRTYNTMLSVAGEAREFQLVEKLVAEMDNNLCQKDIKTWTILISLYGNAKLISLALLVFENMRKCGCEPDAQVYKKMVRALCFAGKADIAIEFYKEMVQKDMALDVGLYKMLMVCISRSGDIAALRSIADDMIRVFQTPEHDVYGYVLKSLCISGKIREALEWIRELKDKDVTLNPEYFETLVKGLCRADRIADSLEIVDIMKRKYPFDGKIYGIIINGYLRRNDISKALDLFQSMKESGHLPLTSTYTELMQHLFRLDDYEKGCMLYEEMLERGVEPDTVAITAMVAGHVSQNRISEAWKVFRSMEDKGMRPTWKSYSVFIKELCKVSRTEEIFKVLNEMRASKIDIRDEIFDWIISYLEKKRELDSIEKIKQMQRIWKLYPQGELPGTDASRDQEPNLELNSNQSEEVRMDSHFMEPLPKNYDERDVKESCWILTSSTDWCLIQEALEKCNIHFTPDLVVEILHNCNVHGSAALHFFSWVGKQTGYSHTTETYNMAIKIAGRGKDFQHMRNLFYEMRRRGCPITSDTWTIMIMLYGRTGLTEIALKVFGEMKADGCNPSRGTYKYLIMNLCRRKGRKVDEAIKFFEEMMNAGHIPDKELVEAYLGCLCEVGRLLEARRCTDSLPRVGFTVPLSHSLYIRALCRVGRLKEAQVLFDEVSAEGSALDQYTYGSLVHGLLQKGCMEEALAKVDSMKQAGINPTVHVYTSLISHFMKEKQIERAHKVFHEMQREGCQPTVVTYSELIRGYMNMGKFADAWNIFHRMKVKGPLPDFKTYSIFITSLCKVGKSEEALQLISEMLDGVIVPSTVNFREVFYGLNREGKQDLARTVLQQKSALRSKRKFLI